MFIERPHHIFRKLWKATWRKKSSNGKAIYLTFDDGPCPKTTPPLLDILDKYNIKASFFCVGDNVRKHPDIYEEMKKKGHSVGNHTMHHIKGFRHSTERYIEDVEEASKYIDSNLFRPPYGRITRKQLKEISKNYEVIMWDLITRDYNPKLSPEYIYKIVCRYSRNGSIIVFHDSEKASRNMLNALPPSIEWLKRQGYTFKTL